MHTDVPSANSPFVLIFIKKNEHAYDNKFQLENYEQCLQLLTVVHYITEWKL